MKKKGFTLIELLAVIIILAVVALIATPIVLNIIEEAKASAAKSEASLILKGVTDYCGHVQMKKKLGYSIEDDFDCKEESISREIILTDEQLVKMVNNFDKDNNIIVKLLDGKVMDLTVQKGSKIAIYNPETGKINVQDEETLIAVITQDYSAIGNSIYYNVTTGAECNPEEYAANPEKNGNTGCMKFYVLDNHDSKTIDLVLDHAIGFDKFISDEYFKFEKFSLNQDDMTSQSIYCAISANGPFTCACETFNECPQMGPITILDELYNLTSHYKGTKTVGKEYSYKHKATSSENYAYTISMNGFKARFIGEEELKELFTFTNFGSTSCNSNDFSGCVNSKGDNIGVIVNILPEEAYDFYIFPLGLTNSELIKNQTIVSNMTTREKANWGIILPVITLNKGA